MFSNTKKGVVVSYTKNIIACAMIFALIYYLNYLTPLFADDYPYSFSFADRSIRLSNIVEIIESQKAHYMTMNGRVVVHSIAQFFLMVGKTWFNIYNALLFVMLIVLIDYHIQGNIKKIKWNHLFFILFGLWCCVPKFGESFLWLIGSCNYLLGITLILIFLIPYRRIFSIKKRNTNIFLQTMFFIFYCFFAVIIGNTNENTSIAVCGFQFLFIIYQLKKDKRLYPWMVAGIMGNIVGGIIILKSPGQVERLGEAGGIGFNISALVSNFLSITGHVFEYLLPIILVIMFCCFVNRNSNIRVILHENKAIVMYGLLCFFATYVMIISPQFPERVWSGSVVFGLIFTGSFLKDVDLNRYMKPVFLILFIGFLGNYFTAIGDLRQSKAIFLQREEQMIEARKTKQKIVECEPMIGYTKYNCIPATGDLVDDSTYWYNTGIAKYYGVDEVKRKNKNS